MTNRCLPRKTSRLVQIEVAYSWGLMNPNAAFVLPLCKQFVGTFLCDHFGRFAVWPFGHFAVWVFDHCPWTWPGSPPASPQAVCEVLKLCGKQLDVSPKSSTKVESYVKHLEAIARDRNLPSRVRFLIRDIVELRRSAWVPRREAVQARKIEEIHAEAQAELGLLPGLPMGLPGMYSTGNV